MGSRYDLWFTRFTGAATFGIGAGTFIYEVLDGGSLEFAALAIGVMGVPLGKAVENFLTWLSSLRPTINDHENGKNHKP